MKALALFSGGLDSTLAMKLITMQGIEVLALHIDTGFGPDEEKFEVLRKRANSVGADFKVVDIRDAYINDVLLNPKFGYGKQFNPCIDCHAYMFKTALNLLEKEKANFIISGEVLGQRPMSQRKEALNQVKKAAKDSDEIILRPMSAKLLDPTKPEILGWVDREKLLGFSGRDRKPQLKLAQKLGVSDYPSPGGGCLLTIASFAVKMKDYVKFEKELRPIDSLWLKVGRHLRLPNGSKMVIGREQSENEFLNSNPNDKFYKIDTGLIGASSYIEKNASDEDLFLASRLALGYTKANKDQIYDVKINEKIFEVSIMDKSLAQEFIVQ